MIGEMKMLGFCSVRLSSFYNFIKVDKCPFITSFDFGDEVRGSLWLLVFKVEW